MLLQAQLQNIKTGETEFVAQKEINNYAEERDFITEVIKNYKVPQGKQWLVCNEKSEDFKRCLMRVGGHGLRGFQLKPKAQAVILGGCGFGLKRSRGKR